MALWKQNEGDFMLQPGVNGVAWNLAPCLELIYGRNTTGWTGALPRARACLLSVSYLYNGYIKAQCHSQKQSSFVDTEQGVLHVFSSFVPSLSPRIFSLLLVTGLIF